MSNWINQKFLKEPDQCGRCICVSDDWESPQYEILQNFIKLHIFLYKRSFLNISKADLEISKYCKYNFNATVITRYRKLSKLIKLNGFLVDGVF